MVARWSKEEVDFLEDNYDTMNYEEIAELLGRSFSSVNSKAFKLGLTKTGFNNRYYVTEEHAVIEIISKGKVYECYVDLDDLEKLIKNNRKVSYSSTGYALVSYKNKQHLLHRFILNFPSCETIDHINFNKLDNRKGNLREFTKSQNCSHREFLSPHNKSGYSGVSYDEYGDRWRVSVSINKVKYRESFKTKEEAIKRRKELEKII